MPGCTLCFINQISAKTFTFQAMLSKYWFMGTIKVFHFLFRLIFSRLEIKAHSANLLYNYNFNTFPLEVARVKSEVRVHQQPPHGDRHKSRDDVAIDIILSTASSVITPDTTHNWILFRTAIAMPRGIVISDSYGLRVARYLSPLGVHVVPPCPGATIADVTKTFLGDSDWKDPVDPYRLQDYEVSSYRKHRM